MPLKVVADTQFLGKRGNRGITLEKVMVKDLETSIRDRKGGGLPSETTFLPDGNVVTRLRQSQGGSEPCKAAADNSDPS